jgi:cell division protein FtsN
VRPAVPANPNGRWTVEVSPTLNRLELEALRARLSDKGYDARVVTVRRDGNTWYRLRVGRYNSSAQATQVMRTLRENEGVAHAFVASQ